MLIGLVLYNTRSGDEPTNQHGLISAPETPIGAAGKNEGRHGCGVRSTHREVSRPALWVTYCGTEYISARFVRFGVLSDLQCVRIAVPANFRFANIIQ
jgi:hypothetical protein